MGMSHESLSLLQRDTRHSSGRRHKDDIRTRFYELCDVLFSNDLPAGFTCNTCTVHLTGNDHAVLPKYFTALLYRSKEFIIRHTCFRVSCQTDEVEPQFSRFLE